MANFAVREIAGAEGYHPLGERLRKRRRTLGLTLKEVAVGSGLSVGFISQIERGIAAPSLSSLVSVARVLGTEVGEFLSQPKGNVPITRHDQRPVYAVSPHSLTYERVSSSFPGNVLRSVIIHEPPGHRSEPISHEGEEMFYLLEGTVTVEVAGERTVLEAGDSLHFPSTKTHSSWNHSDRPATILWVGTMDVFGDDLNEEHHKESGAVHGGSRNKNKRNNHQTEV
ncbi:cupin domain-containing protein [Chelativorans xinjiangense]|uniref:cupin domain-containing protein n=1 Tax=Chelativorans xinjiangense TaxID=2681485 RepID=UPI00135A1790|nr:cupin domain-containing protein [Chelativorans xinjiangense]